MKITVYGLKYENGPDAPYYRAVWYTEEAGPRWTSADGEAFPEPEEPVNRLARTLHSLFPDASMEVVPWGG